MRMRAQSGAACWHGCSAEDGDLGCGPEPGDDPGAGAGHGRGTAVRSVPGAEGTCPHTAAGQRAGSAVLADHDGGAVFVVAGCLGRMDPAVWGGGIAGRRSGLFSSVQPAGAEIWLLRCGCDNACLPSGTASVEFHDFAAEKIEKICKK